MVSTWKIQNKISPQPHPFSLLPPPPPPLPKKKKKERKKKKKPTVLCAIQYHLYNLKNVKKTHGGMTLLLKLQTEASNVTESITPPCVFFTFLKLYRWHQIALSITRQIAKKKGRKNFKKCKNKKSLFLAKLPWTNWKWW